jgi:glycosyltransferase involved in cell wall biosynthesis
MTNILFVHPNFPAQFKHIIPALVADGGYQLAYISRKRSIKNGDGILFEQYDFERQTHSGVHRYLQYTQEAIREAREVSICATNLVNKGYVPDIIIGHTAWGGLLFMKDIFPKAKVIAYCELYFSEKFDHLTNPEDKVSNDRKAFLRCRNFHPLMQMESMDVGITPTKYQLQSHPPMLQNKMVTVHEGVDTSVCTPDSAAQFPVTDTGISLSKKDTVITYVSRGFEPARGFFQYMEALELLCEELSDAHFLMVGGDKSFYSGHPGEQSYRQQALERYNIDHERVHFTGRLIHEGFRKVLQISSAHVYLTRPLFLSWSVVEAMSMAAPIVASNEALVREFMTDGENALLVDQFKPREIADAVKKLVNNPQLSERLGQNARRKIVDHYDISDTVDQWMKVIQDIKQH